jgi:hypothetical protein
MKNPLGLSDSDIGRLTSHAQEHFGPEDFSAEVQKYLDMTPSQKGEESFSDSQKQEAQAESISNLSVPEEPIIPSPAPAKKSGLPAKNPDWQDLGSGQ